VIAATSGTTCNAFLGGQHPETGEPYVWYSINSQGGWGGRAEADGWHNVCFIEANGWDIPVETIEYRYPWRVRSYRLRTDAAGAGRHRGGEGPHRVVIVGHDGAAVATARTSRSGSLASQGRLLAASSSEQGGGVQIAPTTMKAKNVPLERHPRDRATSGASFGNRSGDARSSGASWTNSFRSSARGREYGVVIDS
jgi:hypothetical protein